LPTTADALAALPTTSDQRAGTKTTAEALAGADVADPVGNVVTLAGNATVGFTVPINGATLAGRSIVDPQFAFGRYEPGTRSPTRGAPITSFSEPLTGPRTFDSHQFFGRHMARQSMVSSQATFEYARGIDPGLRNTVFDAHSRRARRASA